MKVLIACEHSGIVRDAFIKAGHDAISCDLLPSDTSGPHYKGDVRAILNDGWDLMIAHPDCTYLCSSGLHWNKRTEGRQKLSDEALEFAKVLLNSNIEKIALENPVGRIGSEIREADQYIQPYEYGHNASKKTGLWLKNLPTLKPTKFYAPRLAPTKNGKGYTFRWGNQTDSGQNNLGLSDDRWKLRSKTYQGWADAMSDQWG